MGFFDARFCVKLAESVYKQAFGGQNEAYLTFGVPFNSFSDTFPLPLHGIMGSHST